MGVRGNAIERLACDDYPCGGRCFLRIFFWKFLSKINPENFIYLNPYKKLNKFPKLVSILVVREQTHIIQKELINMKSLDILLASTRPMNDGMYYRVSFYVMSKGRPLSYDQVKELQDLRIINKDVKFTRGAGNRAIHFSDFANGFTPEEAEQLIYGRLTD